MEREPLKIFLKGNNKYECEKSDKFLKGKKIPEVIKKKGEKNEKKKRTPRCQ